MKQTARGIIMQAIDRFRPKKCLLLVSGGHDSTTNAHVSAEILKAEGIDFVVYHGDTTIGIPETQQHVKDICRLYNWPLVIRQPPNREEWYDKQVEKYGFPGPTKHSHQIMYRLLKERALRKYITHELKTTPQSRENVLLLTGIRQNESVIRMGYTEVTRKEDSRIWTSPIFHWTEEDCRDYMAAHSMPRNPVKDKICISGECLCGAFAGAEEWAEIKHHYPATATIISNLHALAIANGHPWPWSSGPNEWRKERFKKSQLTLNFMCTGCELKRKIIS